MSTKFDKWVADLAESFDDLEKKGLHVRAVHMNDWMFEKFKAGMKMKGIDVTMPRWDKPEDAVGCVWDAWIYVNDMLSHGEIELRY